MFIRQGLYQGGVYRFQLFIPDTYPDADCPVSDLFKYIYCATDFDNYFNLTYNEYISSNSLEKSCPQTHCSHCLRIRELYLIFLILFQSLIFDPPVFHPIINASSGELDVKRAFPKWKWVLTNKCSNAWILCSYLSYSVATILLSWCIMEGVLTCLYIKREELYLTVLLGIVELAWGSSLEC